MDKPLSPPETPLALSVKDFCRRMSISPSTFWKYVRAGEIRVIRLGNRTLISAAEIARLLGEGEAA
jgi:excisionase family DNA binding protein